MGLALSAEDALTHMNVCFRINLALAADGGYPDMDFGYAERSDRNFIYPLGEWRTAFLVICGISLSLSSGLNETDITVTIIGTSTFWCANLSLQTTPLSSNPLLFPLTRLTDYESFTESYCDHETKSLMYTLGVLYSVLGLVYFIMIVCGEREGGGV